MYTNLSTALTDKLPTYLQTGYLDRVRQQRGAVSINDLSSIIGKEVGFYSKIYLSYDAEKGWNLDTYSLLYRIGMWVSQLFTCLPCYESYKNTQLDVIAKQIHKEESNQLGVQSCLARVEQMWLKNHSQDSWDSMRTANSAPPPVEVDPELAEAIARSFDAGQEEGDLELEEALRLSLEENQPQVAEEDEFAQLEKKAADGDREARRALQALAAERRAASR